MDKKNLIIGGLALALGLLAYEYKNLVHDFKLLNKAYEEDAEKFEQAKQIVTDVMFDEIVEDIGE